FRGVQGRFAVANGLHAIPFPPETVAKNGCQVFGVLNYQNVFSCRHPSHASYTTGFDSQLKIGTLKAMVVPTPRCEQSSMSPSCASTILRTSARPSPSPATFACFAPLPR